MRGGNNIRYKLISNQSGGRKHSNKALPILFYRNAGTHFSQAQMIVIIGKYVPHNEEGLPVYGQVGTTKNAIINHSLFAYAIPDLIDLVIKIPRQYAGSIYEGHGDMQYHRKLLFNTITYQEIQDLFNSRENTQNFNPAVTGLSYVTSCKRDSCDLSIIDASGTLRNGDINPNIVIGKIKNSANASHSNIKKSVHTIQRIIVETYNFIEDTPGLRERCSMQSKFPVLMLL